MPVVFKEVPRYTILPASQDKVLEAGKIVGWTINVTMFGGGIMHTKSIAYMCEKDEILEMDGDLDLENRTLEAIIQKLENTKQIFKLCADELEAKINAAKNGEANA